MVVFFFVMVKGKKILWLAVKLIIFALLLSSARACIVPLNNLYYELFLTIICFLYMNSRNMFMWKIQAVSAAILLCILSMYTMHGASVLSAYVGMFVSVLMPVLLLGLKDGVKIELFDDFSNWMAILLVFSMVFWGLYLLGVPLPHSSQTLDVEGSERYLIVDNYFFFRTSVYSNQILFEFPRFNGFFLEPGHMGTILAFFLYANGYDLKKKRNIVFIVAILITLSAAAYTITIIGYVFYKAASGSLKNTVRALLLVGILVLVALLYNGGDNVVNDLILGKLTREEGALDGRVTYKTKLLYDKLWSSGDYLWGLGYVHLVNSAGFKVFFVMNGIVGVILTILSYFKIYKTAISKFTLYMFFLYMINFTQRTYCLWDAFLDPFILGGVYLNYVVVNKEKHNEKPILPAD